MKVRRIVRTTEVIVETEEKAELRGSQDHLPSLMWCPACRRQVEMVTPEQAAQIAGVSQRTIYRWVESGKLHFSETPEGLPIICGVSLAQPSPIKVKAAQ